MLSEEQKRLLIGMIERGEPLPAEYRRLLFAQDGVELVERTGVYSLEYKGKAREQDILADTPAAPLQEIRDFNADNPHPEHPDWRNLLIYGDNLLALKALYEDQHGPNRFGTRNRIKLIYIDPPFATKQDFMKDREKAYRDKLVGAQFIEFLRKRLVLLREVLADDGSIYVHLDQKKGHYIKAVMDEVFGEENFLNEIIWKRTPFAGSSKARSMKFPVNHDGLLLYSKSDAYIFHQQYVDYSPEYVARFKYKDENGQYRKTLLKTYSAATKARLIEEGRYIAPERDGAYPSYKQYLHESKGKQIEDIWTDLNLANPMADERVNYPTQKPEQLIERIISASSNQDDIVLDAFMGSGSTPATAEKIGRRWIGIDCGRLAIYTAQQRLLNLSGQIGAGSQDDRREHERIEDFAAHSKSGSKAALLLFDKACNGELAITDALLSDFAKFLTSHLQPRRGQKLEFSLLIPEEKLQLDKLEAIEDENLSAGARAVEVGGVRFLISFIEPRARAERPQPLKAKHFALFNAGVYDRDKLRALDWARYKPFVMQLFGVRDDPHPIRSFQADGFIGTDSVHVWNYPDQPTLALDEGYIESLHGIMRGEAGEKFYVIAPVSALTFMSDELRFGNTRYIILKVPESVLNRLLESGAGGALRQPMAEADVNEVIDAIGFDFVSQPQIEQQFLLLPPEQEDLLTAGQRDAVVRLTEFRARTMTTAPEDYPNFSTLSMVMIDPDFDGDVFSLGSVQWGEALVAAELKRLDVSVNGDHAARAAACERLDIRIPAASLGERVMVILVDRYGNEKRLEIARDEFAGGEPRRERSAKKTAVKKTAAKKAAAKKTGGRRRGR